MEHHMTGNFVKEPTDYFAKRLLEKLDAQDPIAASYEAQDESKRVGFDFSDIAEVVERALDEVRETREAFDEGEEGKEHFGDEIADLAFSLTNLARHRGIPAHTLPSLHELPKSDACQLSVIDATEEIATDMRALGDTSVEDGSVLLDVYTQSIQRCVALASAHDFAIDSLLTENVRKYLHRCEAIETLAEQDGKSWHDLAAAGEIVQYWKKAKSIL